MLVSLGQISKSVFFAFYMSAAASRTLRTVAAARGLSSSRTAARHDGLGIALPRSTFPRPCRRGWPARTDRKLLEVAANLASKSRETSAAADVLRIDAQPPKVDDAQASLVRCLQ